MRFGAARTWLGWNTAGRQAQRAVPLSAWRDLYRIYYRMAPGRSLIALLRGAYSDGGWLPCEILEREA